MPAFFGPGEAGIVASRSPATPLLLKLVAIALGFYALLPSLMVPPVATEGFEAAVSSGVNQPLFAPSPVPFPDYNYDSRPGEFFFYRVTDSLVHVDALLVGQVWSLVAYASAIAGIMLLATRSGLARPWIATLGGFTLFDLASNMAQVSSSNPATGFLALGAGLFMLGGTGSVIAVPVLAVAAFCRLDVLMLVPFALFWSVLVQPSLLRFLVRCVVAGTAVGGLVVLLYASQGLSVIDVLQAHKSVALGWSFSAVRGAFHMISPWTLLPALLGVSIGQWATWRSQPVLALTRAFAIFAPAGAITLIYLGQMDTPRFISPAATFLAVGTAMLVEAATRARPTVRAASAVGLAAAVAITWFVRQPLTIWDGFRYKYATYLAPYEMYREKSFLNTMNDFMYADALEDSCAECLNRPLEVLSIEWRQFNEFNRRMVLAGARLRQVRIEPLAGTPAVQTYRFDDHGRAVSVYLFERPREFTTPVQSIAAAAELDRLGDVTVLVSDADLLAALLAGLPTSTRGFAASYDRWETHLSQFSLHLPQATSRQH